MVLLKYRDINIKENNKKYIYIFENDLFFIEWMTFFLTKKKYILDKY